MTPSYPLQGNGSSRQLVNPPTSSLPINFFILDDFRCLIECCSGEKIVEKASHSVMRTITLTLRNKLIAPEWLIPSHPPT